MKRCSIAALALLVVVLTMPEVALGDTTVAPGGGTPGTSSNFRLAGHEPLFGRGMNAALAVFGHYVYVGNRTDGSDVCGAGDPRAGVTPCPHPHPGILIVDAADPRHPAVVGEIGPPHAGLVGITTRELRVWPQRKLLIVITFRCSAQIHACPPGNDTTFPFDLKFFDLADPIHPRFISSYVPTSRAGVQVKPHEMYLWVDPRDPGRALLWLSTPTLSVNPNRPNLMIVDISQVPSGGPPVGIAEGNWNQLFPGAEVPANYDADLDLHSMAPTADGRTTYLAHLRGGMGVLDTREVVADTDGHFVSLNDKLLTPVDSFVRWGAGNQCPGHTAVGCSESHSAVPVPGRPFELSTDEVYGTFTVPSFGWPWGWARLVNVAQPKRPHLVGEYKILQNTQAFQPSVDPATEAFTSYSSHGAAQLGAHRHRAAAVGQLEVQVAVAPVDQSKAILLGVVAGRLDPPLAGPAGAGPHPGQGRVQGDLDLVLQVQVRPAKQVQQAGQVGGDQVGGQGRIGDQACCGWRQR